MEHPQTRALFEYWNDLRNGRAAPFRSEIDPRQISVSLENMFVLEALPHGQLRFRVAGTGLSAMFGLELRGMIADSIMASDSADKLRSLAKQVLETPAVGAMRADAISGIRRYKGIELLLLPLRSEVGEMNRLLGCINALDEAPIRGEFDQMRLSCVSVSLIEPHLDDEAEPLDAFMGMAEPQTSFLRDDPAQPKLKAIEGARKTARKAEPTRGRGHLRLVKD
jgi:hypothetical protein